MLEVRHLTKSFGDLKALDDVGFEVRPGQILGLIGPNGSGKTTAFRLILNLLTPDQGKVIWRGKSITPQILHTIGYLPEERGLFLNMSIENQILYFAELNGKKRKEILPEIPKWLEKFDVKGKPKDKIKSLSKGNQQKIQLITTLIHEPELIILDEPFSGLDPVNAELLVSGIQEAEERGACIIFSSHNMANVEELCDELLMLINGKSSLYGKVRDIRESYGRTRVVVETEDRLEELLQLEGVVSGYERPDGLKHLILSSPEAGEKIFNYVTRKSYVQTFSQQAPSLEEIFKLKVGESYGRQFNDHEAISGQES